MKLVKSIATSALAVAAIAAMAQTDPQRIRVVVDGQRVHFGETQPAEVNGRIMVPLRGIFESLGAKVNWDPTTRTITATRKDEQVSLAVGQLDASVNGQDTRLDVPAQLQDGVTMVPLRFVSEALGAVVHWDQAELEVDITSGRDYNIPKRDVPPPTRQVPPPTPPPIIVNPPPVIVTAPPPAKEDNRPIRIVRTYDEIRPDTVIPLILDTPLSSKNSKPGDPFSATVDTNRSGHYLSLPGGTQVYGTVSYVKKQHRRVPGVVEIHFDHLILPSGRQLPVNGKLIGLDDASVMRQDDGRIVSKNDRRGDTQVFVAEGQRSSIVVGLPTDRPLRDATVSNMVTNALDPNQRTRLARDLELDRGTHFGLRLYEGIVIPRDEK